jgi:hypothetical protein
MVLRAEMVLIGHQTLISMLLLMTEQTLARVVAKNVVLSQLDQFGVSTVVLSGLKNEAASSY